MHRSSPFSLPPALRVARGPWTTRSLWRSRRRRPISGGPRGRMRCMYMPHAPKPLMEKNWTWSAAGADAITSARAPPPPFFCAPHYPKGGASIEHNTKKPLAQMAAGAVSVALWLLWLP